MTTVETSFMEDLMLARKRLAPLLAGRRVAVSRQQMSMARSRSSVRRFADIEHALGIKTRLDDRQSAVVIYANNCESAVEAEQQLMDLLNTVVSDVAKDISLRDAKYPRGLMKALVVRYGPNVERLKEESGVDVLELILCQYKLRVQGTRAAFDRLTLWIDDTAREVAERSTTTSDRLTAGNLAGTSGHYPECPICLGAVEPRSMYVMESCGHVYCRGCAEDLIENATRNNNIPIRCCYEGCHNPLAIVDLRNLLRGDLERLYDTAVRAFMLTNGDSYSSCVTPDCRMVYRRAPPGCNGKDFVCSECGVTLCTACNTVSHPGLLCNLLRLCGSEDRAGVVRWVGEDPGNRCGCPKCGVGIEKNGGCMHMECTACHTHFCWHCKAHCETSAECYGHLYNVHGSYA